MRSATATLNGQVDPTGDPGLTECHFEYVAQAAFEITGFTDLSSGGMALCSGVAPYTEVKDVSAGVESLEAGETYRFRVVAVTTSSGTVSGAAQSFTTVHGELGSFGSNGSEASTFGEFGGAQLGFNQVARRLYTVDLAIEGSKSGVWGFDVSSSLPPFSLITGFNPLIVSKSNVGGIVIDNSELATAGRVYYISEPAFGYGSGGGTPVAEFPLPNEAGAAVVDSAGHLWVEGKIGGGGERLDEFVPSGGPPIESISKAELPTGLAAGLNGIAIGAADELYVLARDRRQVWKLSAESDYREGVVLIQSESALAKVGSGLAFDRRSHHLYIANGGAIAEYDAAGAKVDEFGEVAGALYGDLAVDEANHLLYAADRNAKKVRVFDAGAAFPAFELKVPSPLENTAATLRATINPEGSPLSECRFEFVSEADFLTAGGFTGPAVGEAPCEPAAEVIPPDSSDHVVSTEIDGLLASTAYRYRLVVANAAGETSAEESFTTPGPPSVETTGSPVPSATSAVFSGRVDPHGEVVEYYFEYGTQGPCGSNPCASTPVSELATDEVQQVRFFALGGTFKLSFGGGTTPSLPFDASAAQVQATLEGLGGIGAGNVRVVGGRSFAPDPSVYNVTFTGDLAGTDVRPITGSSQVLTQTAIRGGVDSESRLVSARVGGLLPDTSYHYRVVADNDNPAGPSFGEDMTLETHPMTPLSHGDLPGPPGSDRAYEQVSISDSGGNPAVFALAFSADGERAIYQVSGGTPISPSGTLFSQLLAERTVDGWVSRTLTPRSLFEPSAPDWFFFPDEGLGELVGYNTDGVTPEAGEVQNLWRVALPSGPYTPLVSSPAERSSEFFEASDDTSRTVAVFRDDLDPSHPAAPEPGEQQQFHLYDVSGGGLPRLISLLPGEGENVPACGVNSYFPTKGENGNIFSFNRFDLGKRRWLSADGELSIFPSKGDNCSGPVELYVRDIAAAETRLISGPTLSEPACSAAFLRATPEAAFFWTQSRLVGEDTLPASCSGSLDGDVYRYEFDSGGLVCVTCAVAGRDADVRVLTSERSALIDIGVSQDGSAVYFTSPNRLTAGAASAGVYRVDVASGELAYVAPGIVTVGDALAGTSAVSADGQVLVFRSADPRLDPKGGSTNGGFPQYYRYEHRDRSLICVSCPPNGSPPRGSVVGLPSFESGAVSASTTYNGTPLSADGEVFVFDAPSALVSADQNTTSQAENPQHGQDVYEWREGRALLISDGLGNWPEETALDASEAAPEPAAVSPDGRSVFFFAAAQYTPDAIDPYRRLYAARIGGGFEFPVEEPECALEVCQGTPRGAPEVPLPGSRSLRGAGNQRQAVSCARSARAAKRLAGRAMALRRAARRSASARRSQSLHRRVEMTEQKAARRATAAKRCRQRANRNQGEAR